MAGSAIVPTPASLTSRRHPHTCTLVQCQSPHDAAILRLHRLRIVPMLSLIGLVAALTLLVIVTVRGMSLFIATPICALLVALTSDIALFPQLAASGQSDLQIGRAPCRGRVFKSVSISVVAVSLKKKKKKT